jgi:hypothetical protein
MLPGQAPRAAILVGPFTSRITQPGFPHFIRGRPLVKALLRLRLKWRHPIRPLETTLVAIGEGGEELASRVVWQAVAGEERAPQPDARWVVWA